MVASKPAVTIAPTCGPFRSISAFVPSVVAYRTESTPANTASRSRPSWPQAWSSASLTPWAWLWCVVSAFAWMYWPSQAKKQSVNVPPMSTEIRFMSRSLSAHVGVDVSAERDRGAGGTSRPLCFQRVHVDFQVEDRRMSGRQVLSLDQRSAARTVELEDPAPGRIGRKREFVALRVNERAVDILRITVVDQCPFLVVTARRTKVPFAAAALPALGVEIDLE